MDEQDSAGAWTAGERRFEVVRASYVTDDRDGMALELTESGGRAAVQVFYDETGQMTFSADSVQDLPLALLERFIERAHCLLPPVDPDS